MPDQLTFDDLDASEPAADPLEALTDLQRDRLIVRLVASLLIGLTVFISALILASALGLIRPNCDGLPQNNRVGMCYADPNTGAPSSTSAPVDLPRLVIKK